MSMVSQIEHAAAQTGVDAAKQTKEAEQTQKKSNVRGKTIGEPKLSEKALKYYEKLKKKYSNMDFILVSSDKKEEAKAQAGSYANANRMVVLIDEEKIEKMAEDEKYRKQYEAVIGNAAGSLTQMKSSLAQSGANVKTYGMQVNDNGTASFFAVVDKSLASQKERIEKRAQAKKETQKAEEKKAEKKEKQEELEKKRTGSKTEQEEDYVTVTAGSIDELMRKIQDVMYAGMSDHAQTQSEKQVGQHIDYWG